MQSTISILGSGVVGQTLAGGFLKHGYKVIMGTNHPDKKMEWKDQSLSVVTMVSFEEAAKEGDIAVLTVKGTAAEEVIDRVKNNLSGKTVIDTTNPIADSPPQNGVLPYFTSMDESLMERLQKIAPEAHFVKAFNSIGAAFMVNPSFEITPTMFICGNSENAKKQVSDILKKFGFDPEDMGTVEAARPIEALCVLWCIPGFARNEWSHAFKLLKK